FGDPNTAQVALADPRAASLLAFGDDDGMTAAGGQVTLRVGGRSVGPVALYAGDTPNDAAERVANAMRAAGLAPRVSVNPRTDFAAHPSVDVLAHDAAGRVLVIEPPAQGALSTEPRMSVRIGRVDLTDGVDEFNNLDSAAGTLEERA